MTTEAANKIPGGDSQRQAPVAVPELCLAVQTTTPDRAETRRSFWSELVPALREHLYRAKLIIYGSLLVAGGIQIVIRERFPEVHPPWRWIGGTLMVVLFGILVVPPFLLVIRLRIGRKSKTHETNSDSL